MLSELMSNKLNIIYVYIPWLYGKTFMKVNLNRDGQQFHRYLQNVQSTLASNQ